MGSSPPSAPVTVMPAPTAPTIYKSVVPLESYQQTADYLKRIQEQTNIAQQVLDIQSGTPGQVGARKAATEMQAAATYAAFLPKGDKYLQETTGVSQPYAAAQQVADQRLSDAQAAYAEALKNINTPRQKIDTSGTPSWATSTTT